MGVAAPSINSLLLHVLTTCFDCKDQAQLKASTETYLFMGIGPPHGFAFNCAWLGWGLFNLLPNLAGVVRIRDGTAVSAVYSYRHCYGLTEANGPVTLCDGIKGRYHLSIGRLMPSMEAKIIDVDTKKPLPTRKFGELCLRGPPIMQGYYKNEEGTAQAIDMEGWLHTGDLCFIDNSGLVYLVDRIKELIKYKAYQVAPAELEEILVTHPEIGDAAVIPYPNVEAGEIPMACVVRMAGSKLQEEDVISFMADKVAPYKKIRKVAFVNSIPRSPSGKILRRHLKASTHRGVEISSRL